LIVSMRRELISDAGSANLAGRGTKPLHAKLRLPPKIFEMRSATSD
jgi:hypothetical protein